MGKGHLGDVSGFILSAGMLRDFKFKVSCPSLFMILRIMCHMDKPISEQEYNSSIYSIEVFEKGIEGLGGVNWLSLILILGGADDLFNLLLFLA